MTTGLQPYPEYKDSGLPWLGQVPVHWELVRVKHLFQERNVRGYPDEQLLAATQTKGVVRKEDYENRTVLAMKDLQNLKLVRVNDFVISLRSFQGGIEYARHQGIISPAYTVLYLVNQKTHGYFAILFKSSPFIDGLTLFVTGIRQGQNIDYVKLSRSPLPVPPPVDQEAIVAFLGDFQRRYNRFIRNRRRLIEVLNEQKRAIINRAVTRGLNSNAKLKPSGVEWIGDIPEHWEVRKVKHIGQVRIGLTYSPSELVDSESGTLVLRASNIRDGILVLIDNVYVSKAVPDNLRVKPGDILICVRSGSRSLVGKSALVSEDVVGVSYGAFMSVLRCSNSRFVYWVMNSHMFPYIMAQFETSTINQLTQYDLRNLVLPFPSDVEQDAIVLYLEKETSTVEYTINRAEREIELMREYRTRLIADVVTGKVDVRHLAPPPEAVAAEAEPEDLDEGLDDEMPGEDEVELAGEVTDADD